MLALEEQINVRVFIQAQQDTNSSTLTQVNYQSHLTGYPTIGNFRSRSKKKKPMPGETALAKRMRRDAQPFVSSNSHSNV